LQYSNQASATRQKKVPSQLFRTSHNHETLLTLCGKQELTVLAPVFLNIFNINGSKTLADGAGRLVGSKNSCKRQAEMRVRDLAILLKNNPV